MSLVTVTPAGEVSAEFKAAAKGWEVWDSKTYPKKFPYKYPDAEHVLVISGKAKLTPDDGSVRQRIVGAARVHVHVRA